MADPRLERVRRRLFNNPASDADAGPNAVPGRQTLVERPARDRVNALLGAVGAQDVTLDDLDELDRDVVQDFSRQAAERRPVGQPPSAERARTESYTTVDGEAVSYTRGLRRRSASSEPDGEHEVATEADASVGLDGVRLGARRRRDIEHPDGSTTTVTGGAELDLLEGQLTGSLTSERGPNGERSSVSGAVDVDRNGRFEGASTAVGHRTENGREFSVTGGFTVKIEEPERQPDGRWRVTGKLTVTGGASGATGVHGGEGHTVSVSGHGSVAHARRFVRQFASESAAREFHDHAERYFGAAAVAVFDVPDSAGAALRMAIGDERSTTNRIAGGGELAFRAQPLTATASGELATTHGVTVIRTDHDHVRIRMRDTGSVDASARASVHLAAMGAGIGRDDYGETTYEFDVSTNAGIAALDRALRGGGVTGTGWRVVDRVHGRGERESSHAGLFGLDVDNSSELRDEDHVDADGRHHSVQTGTAELTAELPTWLGRFVADDGRERTEVRLTDDGGRVTAELSGSSARDTMAALGRATGLPTNPLGVDGDDAGTWEIDARFTDGQIRAFVTRVLRDDADLSALAARAHGDYQTLRRELRAARSFRAARVAVVRFASETGSDGIALIRTQTGARPRFAVTLQGSDVFVGPGGHARTDRRIAELAGALDGHANRLEPALELQRELHDRRAAMQDDTRFRELPLALRSQELATVERQISRLRPIITEAQAVAREDHTGTAPMCGRDDDPPEPSAEGTAATAAIQRDAATMTAAQHDARRVRDRVVAQRGVHDGHVDNGGFPPRTTLYQEADRYARADAAWTAAEAAWTRAEAAFADYDQARARFETATGPLSVEQLQLAREVRSYTWEAARHYRAALAAYRTAYANYGAIRRASLGRGEVGLWADHAA